MKRPTDILEKYPIQNTKWVLIGGVFETDISDFGMSTPLTDPWNRNFPNKGVAIKDDEGEIVKWELTTTVEGETVNCKIFND